jgi:histidinol-phosphate aminotransferase
MRITNRFTRRGFLAGLSAGAALGWSRLGLAQELKSAKTATDTDPNGVKLPLLLDHNENPYGAFPSALEALRAKAGEKTQRYPEGEPKALVELLAKHYGVEPEQVLLGAGSSEILKITADEFASTPGRPIVAEPTYEALAGYAGLRHADAVKIPVTPDYRHDLEKMLAATKKPGAGLVFMCNPGNPTGTMMKKDEVERFVRAVPSSVVVLADEAYAEFVDRPDYESCLRYVKEGMPNLIVSRTFSKIYGLAGARLGFAIGPKELIKRMAPHKVTYSTNQLGIIMAMVSLTDQESIVRSRRLNAEVRTFLCDELKKMGLGYIPSETNFVTIHIKRQSKEVIEALKEKKVLIGRVFPSIPEHVRVSLGTMDEMKYFLKEFRAVLATPPKPAATKAS